MHTYAKLCATSLHQARLLQHEVLLNQPSSPGTATASLCKLRMQLLQDAYEAATQAVRLNNTSQLSISLLFAVVLQLLVEMLVVRWIAMSETCARFRTSHMCTGAPRDEPQQLGRSCGASRGLRLAVD